MRYRLWVVDNSFGPRIGQLEHGYKNDFKNGKFRIIMLVTFFVILVIFPVYQHPESVTNISNLSPTHLVSNIRHQHRCNRSNCISFSCPPNSLFGIGRPCNKKNSENHNWSDVEDSFFGQDKEMIR